MQIYSDPSRAASPTALPDVEVFYAQEGDLPREEHYPSEAGWYYWYCFPGCMPDSEPSGPFKTMAEAIQDCLEMARVVTCSSPAKPPKSSPFFHCSSYSPSVCGEQQEADHDPLSRQFRDR